MLWGAARLQVGNLLGGKHAPHAGTQFKDPHCGDAGAAQILHLVAAVIKHEADLAFDSLREDHPDLDRRNLGDFVHLRPAALNVKASEQLCCVGGVEGLVEGDLVLLFDLEARMGQRQGQLPVVGDNQEPLTLLVQPSHMVDAGPVVGQKSENRGAVPLVFGGAKHALRFEEHRVDNFLRANDLAAYLDHIPWGDQRSKSFDGAAVDFDPALLNEAFDTAPGAEACGC